MTERVHDRLIEALSGRLRQAVIGDTLDERTTMGPLISAAQRERVEQLVQRRPAKSQVVLGGTRPAAFGERWAPPGVGGPCVLAVPAWAGARRVFSHGGRAWPARCRCRRCAAWGSAAATAARSLCR